MSFAKKGLEAYEQSHSNVSKTGGAEYNSPHHSQGYSDDGPSINEEEAVRHASAQGSGDSSLFSSAMSFVSENKHQHTHPVNEEHVVNSHKEAYENGNAGSLPAHAMGSAAALQVLKQFTSGGGGGSQTQLISMAMAEATKLFDSSGGAASGSKQDAVNGAAMTVMKLFVQSKFSSTIGGGDSGGLGGIMGLASKFM